MEHSQELAELAAALSAAQGEMKPAPMNNTNPFFKSRYSDLATCIETARPVLVKHGLSVTQVLTGECGVTTVLMHKSGQWISDTLTLHPAKSDPQGLGSAITYARRYAFAAIIGLVSDDDDDANAATKGNGAAHAPAPLNGDREANAHIRETEEKVKGTTGVQTHSFAGTIESVEIRTGKKENGTPWTKYGVKVNGLYFSTFDTKMGDWAGANKGTAVRVYYRDDGKYKTIEQLEPANAEEPKDDLPF